MSKAGSALMAIGVADGDDRAVEAARRAIASPLLEVSINGAKGVLFNVTGGPDLTLHEISQAAEVIASAADADANIIFGAVIDPRMQGDIKITVIATGFDGKASTHIGSSPAMIPATVKPPREPLLKRTFESSDLDIPAFLRRR